MNLNKVILIGRVASDINLKATATNQAVASFRIATNRNWTDKAGAKQENTEFHNVVVWARQAELANQFLAKGSLVMIEGRLQTRNWKDASGQTHWMTEVVCENIQFGPRSAGGGQGQTFAPTASKSTPIKKTEPTNNDFEDSLEENLPEINMDEEEIKPEDLPF